MDVSLDGFIERDKARKRKKHTEHKEISFREYLQLLAKDPKIAQCSGARIYEGIVSFGVVSLPEEEKADGVDVAFSLFDEELFGTRRTIYEVMRHFEVAANRGSTGKQLLVLVGPPASGKSSIAHLTQKMLEGYNMRPVFMIKGCPKQEEPLHLLPRYARDMIAMSPEDCSEYPGCEDEHIHLGIKIEGDLCPVCRDLLKQYTDGESGEVRWWDIPVETFTFSAQARRGIGSFEPSDEKSSDITALTGKENINITARYGYNHPRAYELSGEIPAAERGMCEGREILSCPPDILQVFLALVKRNS